MLRRFIYDGNEAAAELDSAGAIQNRYVRGDPSAGSGQDELLVDYSGSGTTSRRFTSSDERGSIISLTDSSGNLVGIDRYDEYGKPQPTNIGRFQYTGQAWLPEANVAYYKARTYLPHLGIFGETDPAGYADSANLYAYVLNDPVNLVDPSGMDTTTPPPCPDGVICVTATRPGSWPAGTTMGGGSAGGSDSRARFYSFTPPTCGGSCTATIAWTPSGFTITGIMRGGWPAGLAWGSGSGGGNGCPTGPRVSYSGGVGGTAFIGIVGASLGVNVTASLPTNPMTGAPELRGAQISVSGTATGLLGLGLYAGLGINGGFNSSAEAAGSWVSHSSATVLQGGAGWGEGVEFSAVLSKAVNWSASAGRLALGLYGAIGQQFTGTLSTPLLGCHQ